MAIGSSIIGLAVGRLTKRHKHINQQPTQSKDSPPPPPQPRLNFFSIDEDVDIDFLLEKAKDGYPVFINVKHLRTAPYARNNLLRNLSVAANLSDMIFHEVATDLYLLGLNTIEMRVETLKHFKESYHRAPIDHAIENINLASS